jgi:hypothetical protein
MYKGSNAEKLHNMCLYDLLCRMQENGSDCVIKQITGKPQNERCKKHGCGWTVDDCRSCIAEWLNEPHKGGSKNA